MGLQKINILWGWGSVFRRFSFGKSTIAIAQRQWWVQDDGKGEIRILGPLKSKKKKTLFRKEGDLKLSLTTLCQCPRKLSPLASK